MNINNQVFEDAITKGETRAVDEFQSISKSGEAVLVALDYQSKQKVRKVLSDWDEDLSDRFVELFVEMATIAGVARAYNNELPLTEDDLKDYLQSSVYFFNSFVHFR